MDNEQISKSPDPGLESSKAHIMAELSGYMSDSIVTTTIIRKSTGNIIVMSFDAGKGLPEITSAFDKFVQVIEGKAEIIIDKGLHLVNTGEGIIIPAHTLNSIKPDGQFKIMLTTIKSGYE